MVIGALVLDAYGTLLKYNEAKRSHWQFQGCTKMDKLIYSLGEERLKSSNFLSGGDKGDF